MLCDGMITANALPPVTHDDWCDRCPAAAQLRASMPAGELLFCRHHAQVHCDGLLAVGAVLSYIGQKD
jgi:hypothetical protein